MWVGRRHHQRYFQQSSFTLNSTNGCGFHCAVICSIVLLGHAREISIHSGKVRHLTSRSYCDSTTGRRVREHTRCPLTVPDPAPIGSGPGHLAIGESGLLIRPDPNRPNDPVCSNNCTRNTVATRVIVHTRRGQRILSLPLVRALCALQPLRAKVGWGSHDGLDGRRFYEQTRWL